MKESAPAWRPEPVVIGSGSEEKKQELKQMVLSRFGEGHFAQLTSGELARLEREEKEKTAAEKGAIAAANEITNQAREAAGVPAFDVPERNIHIIPHALFREIFPGRDEETLGMTMNERQGIAIDENARDSAHPEVILSTILHEMVHLKGALTLEQGREGRPRFRRTGIGVHATGRKAENVGDVTYFDGLNEAVVSEFQARHHQELLEKNPETKELAANLFSEEGRVWRDAFVKRFHLKPTDFIWAEEEEADLMPYHAQRMVLRYLITELVRDGEFSSEDEALQAFFDAEFSGHLLKIEGPITRAFGEEAFPILGMMGIEKRGNSVFQVADRLSKHRRRALGRAAKASHGQEGVGE